MIGEFYVNSKSSRICVEFTGFPHLACSKTLTNKKRNEKEKKLNINQQVHNSLMVIINWITEVIINLDDVDVLSYALFDREIFEISGRSIVDN